MTIEPWVTAEQVAQHLGIVKGTVYRWRESMTESNRIEYKRELSDGLEKEIVAFLNYHDGGIVYIGIDKNGQTIGISNTASRKKAGACVKVMGQKANDDGRALQQGP